MNIKIIGKAQVVFQGEQDPYGKPLEMKTELDLSAPATWVADYDTAIRLFLDQAEKALKGVQWPK